MDIAEKKSKGISNSFIMIILLLLLIAATAFYLITANEINSVKTEIEACSDRIGTLEEENTALRNKAEKNKYFLETYAMLEGSDLKAELRGRGASAPGKKASEYIKEASSEIAVKNLKYMDNIQCYGDEIVMEYISPDGSELNACIVMNHIAALSDEICRGASTESEKAYLIAKWVSENICYNFDAANSAVTTDVISLETVMALKMTTCAGFSNIFAALCQAQGLYCINMRGGSSDNAEDLAAVPVNHEWNGVFCDGNWLFFDTTWASSNMYINGEYFKGRVVESNFNMTHEEMSSQRRIDRIDFRDFYSVFD